MFGRLHGEVPVAVADAARETIDVGDEGDDARPSLIEQLVHPPSSSLVCSICQDLFRDPVINPACSHSFCLPCIHRAVQSAGRCPLCRAPLAADQLHPNLALQGLIGDLRAFCKFKKYGCSAELPLDEVVQHQASCSYSPFKCPHVSRGCEFSGTQSNLRLHLSNCPYELLKGALDSYETRFELLEQKMAAQARELAELRSLLANGGGGRRSSHSNHPDHQNMLTLGASDANGGASGDNGGVDAVAGPGALSGLHPLEARPLPELQVDRMECVAVIPNAHHSGVTALCPFQASSRLLFSGAHDARLRLWNVEGDEPKLLGDVEAHKYTIWGLIRVEGRLYSASADGAVKCWDCETVQPYDVSPEGHPQAKIYCMTGAENLLMTGSADRSIRVWDVRQPNSQPVADLQGHTRSVWSLKLAPQLGTALLSSGNDGNVNVWDMRTWTARNTLNFNNHEALSVDASADGRHIFAGSSTAKIYAFDAQSGQLSHRLAGHQWEVWQLEVLRSNFAQPVLMSGSYDHSINIWSLDPSGGFALLKSLSGHKGAVHSLRTLNGFAYSGSGDKSIRIWTVR